MRGVGDIVDHVAKFKPPVLADRGGKPGRPAIAGLQHGIAAAGQQLDDGIEGPEIPRPWPAVHQHHQRRRILLGGAERQGDERLEWHAIPTADANDLRIGKGPPFSAKAPR